MNNVTSISHEPQPKTHSKISTQANEGGYHTCTINKPLLEIYDFYKNEDNLKRALIDLPDKIKNFLDLELINTMAKNDRTFLIEWRNKKVAETKGVLNFHLLPGPMESKTIVIANALFGDYSMYDDAPSNLINIFLKRTKTLAETGKKKK